MTQQLREALYEVIARRRDVRAEFTGPPDDAALRRILAAAHQAPSVGNTQPWDFVIVRDPARLARFAAHVRDCRRAFADSLPPDRRARFDPIKIEGIEESGTGIVVTYDAGRGGRHILGRQTVDDVGLFSAVLAIQNLWLAATAEGLGLGWVSFYEECFLADFIGAPRPEDPQWDGTAESRERPVRPIAWLCVGTVSALQEVPDLVRHGWREGRPLAHAIHQERLHLQR